MQSLREMLGHTEVRHPSRNAILKQVGIHILFSSQRGQNPGCACRREIAYHPDTARESQQSSEWKSQTGNTDEGAPRVCRVFLTCESKSGEFSQENTPSRWCPQFLTFSHPQP